MAEVIDISPPSGDGLQKVCYELPTSKETTVFGPVFWDSFQDLASRIPCGSCKEEAESFVRFWHDLKNKDLGKPIQYQDNFDYWVNRVCNNAKKRMIILTIALVVVSVIAIIGWTRKGIK